MFLRLHKLFLATALVPLSFAPALAGPNGASVVAGSATVQGQGTASVAVNQSSQSAIINWNTFNIGAGEKTAITMPGASSVELDRVTGGLGPSQIYGSLSSNGQVFLVNPDGVLVGPTGKINTASFLATTHDIANSDFMAGRYNFSIPGMPNSSVVNQGSITAQSGGFAALVAPGVRNTGTITAKLGTVALASGNAFTLDFYGDNLITLGVNDSIAASVTDVSTGQPLSALVSNTGTLKANGGRVELTAVAARAVVDSVINNTGVVEANTIGTHNGMIELEAATAASKPAGAPTQTVKVSGKLSAAGRRKGTTGGTVVITGENVQLSGATINASGRAGGGAVLIGGDTGGGNPSALAAFIAGAALEPFAVPIASTVSVDVATTINASAADAGNGGKIIVWSNEATTFYGTILAKGGAQSGDGGFVETSGHVLNFDGAGVNTSAAMGSSGSWFLDPYDLTIDASAAATIETNLATTNVTAQTNVSSASGPGIQNSAGNGDIFVNAGISWASANTLTLSAYRNIDIANGVTIANSTSAQPAGNIDLPILVLRADNTGIGVGTVIFSGTSNIDFSGATNGLTYADIFYNPSSYLSPTDFSPHFIGQPSVPDGLTSAMLVNNVIDLQNIEQNLSGTYALGENFSASGVNFTPIGSAASPFTGTFIGAPFDIGEAFVPTLGTTISNLSINSNFPDVGLFGYIGGAGWVDGIGLTNINVTATGEASSSGAIAGYNAGTILNSFSTGSVTGGPLRQNSDGSLSGSTIGGLVGSNDGLLFVAHSSASVNGTALSTSGGLVGFNTGFVDASYATGSVVGPGGNNFSALGGLIGANGNEVSSSYATGSVSGSSQGGGLIGWNIGIITNSYAMGSVLNSGLGNSGGFILVNGTGGTISTAPTGGAAGALVGLNWTGNNNGTSLTGTISQSYATGSVSGATVLGGLIGQNGGTVTSSYWDEQTTGQTNSAGGIGLITSAAKQETSYAGFDFTPTTFPGPPGFPPTTIPATWSITSTVNDGYPYFTQFPPVGSGVTPLSPPSLPTANFQTSFFTPSNTQVAELTPPVISNLTSPQSSPTNTVTNSTASTGTTTASSQEAGSNNSTTSKTIWGYDQTCQCLKPNFGDTNAPIIDTATMDIDGKTIKLTAYANNVGPGGAKYSKDWPSPGSTDYALNGPNQCTALIATYLQDLGFPPLHMGPGIDVASNLASDPKSFQNSVNGSPGNSAPTVGAIVSMQVTGDADGHVAVIKSISPGPNADTIVATLIEQNATVAGSSTFDTNRPIEFTLNPATGAWTAGPSFLTGTSTKTNAPIQVNAPVVDWVDIVGLPAS